MQCPLCERRQARRRCPALGREICAVCCGSKRLSEIACPADCGYLVSAQAHPPAAIRRQHERDLGFIIAMREGLSQIQSDLFWAVLTFVAGFEGDPLLKLTDQDAAEAAGSLAATYETADRGVIYEHRPNSLVAQRLATDIQRFLAELARESGRPVPDRDAAVVLRHLEKGAREAQRILGEGPTNALDAIGRVMQAVGRARADEASGKDVPVETSGSVIVRP